ncbi:MAG: hypothetical protein A3G93_07830 [Nitrospinae bacterium RIFCSPLOWO2_12_FULL_45_22]|nr:MAG: hypothetical protein A3G93_07830 [Nitrospinae bacterium RIFCSPLOWO2_12_FULL_45_22]
MIFIKNRKRRLVIIGVDGVPYRLIRDLSQTGIMPHTASLIKQGILRQMASSIPEVSSVAWSSIITGKNPAEHGIFGFTDLAPATYRLSFPNFSDLKAPPFWYHDPKRRSVIINVPSTYPAESLNGVLISGFVALDIERATYPKTLIPRLMDMDYRIDVDSQKAHSSLDLFLKHLDQTLKARIKAYRYLWENIDWDTFMVVFTETDRLSHFLWDAYEDPSHKYHQAFLRHFSQIDEAIGEIKSRTNEDDSIILLSDHGFERTEKNVYISSYLKNEGFLKLKKPSSGNYSDIDHHTRAFALDPARIYIHLKGKYPRGSVEKEDRDKVICDLEALFSSIEIQGKKVIKRIYRKEEIFFGPLSPYAPDLVLLPHQGFDLKAGLKAKEPYGKDIFTGKHTQHDAFLLVSDHSDDDIMPNNPSVFDIAHIIGRLCNGNTTPND